MVTCANPECDNQFMPKWRLHVFCSQKCRKLGRGRNWRSIRRAAIIEAKHTCTSCGATNCALDAHHKIPVCFWFIMRGNLEGVSNLDNLAVLCKVCHHEAHKSWDAYSKAVGLRKR